MTIGIYALTFQPYSGLIYVGRSVDIEKRLKQHQNQLAKGRHHNYKMQNLYNNYRNHPDFRIQANIIKETDLETLASYEQAVCNLVPRNLQLNVYTGVDDGAVRRRKKKRRSAKKGA